MMTFKSLLTASVLGVISIAASSAAFANDQSSTFCKSGFYAGLQGGRSDTFYSSNSLVSATGPAHSEATRPSESPDIGYFLDKTNTSGEVLSGSRVDDIGIGGRVYAGYQFNPYFALESGYTQYAKTSVNTAGMTKRDTQTFFVFNNNPSDPIPTLQENHETLKHRYSGEITESAIDFVGKATLPLNQGFGLYAKAGAAYISANRHINSTLFSDNATGTDGEGNPTSTTSNVSTQHTEMTKSYQAFRPTAGIGANYSIPNSNISVDASYSRVFSSGAIPQASLLALGAEYKFG